MKTKFLLFVILITNFIIAQTAKFTIDNKNYIIEKIDSNNIISASWRLGHLQIGLKMSSQEKEGAFDNVVIETVGRDIIAYPIGADAQKIIDKTGSEDGCGSISANWFESRERKNKSSSMGNTENSNGYIKIIKIIDNKVSGSFQTTIDGTRVSGSFENIDVKSW